MIPTLQTERLIMRGFTEGDLDDYAEVCGDPEVARYASGSGKPLDREETWRQMATILGHWALRGYGPWAVEERDTGKVVGHAGLWNPEGWPDLEVGWWLARSRWNRGYATESGRAAVDWAFETLRAEHVISVMHPDNAAAHRAATKLGEVFERKTVIRGHDVVIYGIDRATWERQRAERRGAG
jgi:RimJ/RimL family protein N-acetyltransferase